MLEVVFLCNSEGEHQHPTCTVSRVTTFVRFDAEGVIDDTEEFTSGIDECARRNDLHVQKSPTSDYSRLVEGRSLILSVAHQDVGTWGMGT